MTSFFLLTCISRRTANTESLKTLGCLHKANRNYLSSGQPRNDGHAC